MKFRDYLYLFPEVDKWVCPMWKGHEEKVMELLLTKQKIDLELDFKIGKGKLQW